MPAGTFFPAVSSPPRISNSSIGEGLRLPSLPFTLDLGGVSDGPLRTASLNVFSQFEVDINPDSNIGSMLRGISLRSIDG